MDSLDLTPGEGAVADGMVPARPAAAGQHRRSALAGERQASAIVVRGYLGVGAADDASRLVHIGVEPQVAGLAGREIHACLLLLGHESEVSMGLCRLRGTRFPDPGRAVRRAGL